MSGRRASILREMGLSPVWRLRAATVEDAAPAPAETAEPPPSASPTPPQASSRNARAERIARMDWEALEADIAGCSACRLCEQRQQAVPGVGDRQARVMFIGEAPGAEEDRRGEPFVGQAGKLLDAMLASIGLARGQGVYIANTVKCRPPLNRTPQTDEMAACRPYLERQIALVAPDLLVALGRPAAQVLLDSPDLRISAARGQVFRFAEVPVMVTYHPAYLLRNQADKARAWEDLCRIRRALNPLSEA